MLRIEGSGEAAALARGRSIDKVPEAEEMRGHHVLPFC